MSWLSTTMHQDARALRGVVAGFAARSREDAGFHERSARLSMQNVRLLAGLLAGMTLLWWPTDLFLLRAHPGSLAAFFVWRAVALASLALLYALAANEALVLRAPYVVGGVPMVFGYLTLGAAMGYVGGVDGPWFHFLYIAPCFTIAALIPLRLRACLTALTAALLVAGYLAPFPQHRAHPWIAISVGYMVFAVVISIALGHLRYATHRQSDRLACELEALRIALEARVAEQTHDLRSLAASLSRAKEDEARRISRDLHDDLGQRVVALRYALSHTRQLFHCDPASIAGPLDELGRLVNATAEAVRRASVNLRPRVLDELGLVAALEWLVEEANVEGGPSCALRAGPDELEVADEAATAVFRVAQEALTNARKHAGARVVELSLELRDALVLTVCDDGGGLAEGVRQGGLGILGMRERARALSGSLELLPRDPQGVCVRLTLPSSALAAPTGH